MTYVILKNRDLTETVKKHQAKDAALRLKIAEMRAKSQAAIGALEYAQKLANG